MVPVGIDGVVDGRRRMSWDVGALAAGTMLQHMKSIKKSSEEYVTSRNSETDSQIDN